MEWSPALPQFFVDQIIQIFVGLFENLEANIGGIEKMELFFARLDFVVFDEIRGLLQHSNGKIRASAVSILGMMKKPFLRSLFDRMLTEDPNVEVRYMALLALKKLERTVR